MEETFWHKKWEKGEIGFHQDDVNRFLLAHLGELKLEKNSRIFIPLCGKTHDIGWMLANGYRVVGSELSELAIIDLFEDLGIIPKISKIGKMTLYQEKNIDIFVGNIFGISIEILGNVNAIYDRAALVALPETIRNQYTSHLIHITEAAPQLLITFEYDQGLIEGPPFSINEEEVTKQYAKTYQLRHIESKEVIGGLKGKVPSSETVWILES